MQVVGNFNGMVQLLEKEKTPTGSYTEGPSCVLFSPACEGTQLTCSPHLFPITCSAALFGVSLNILMKYEATDSHHGVGPGTIKVPTFVDHCITALVSSVRSSFFRRGNYSFLRLRLDGNEYFFRPFEGKNSASWQLNPLATQT